MTQNAQATKTKTNRWVYIKLKNLMHSNTNQQNEEATYRRGENINKPYS